MRYSLWANGLPVGESDVEEAAFVMAIGEAKASEKTINVVDEEASAAQEMIAEAVPQVGPRGGVTSGLWVFGTGWRR